jgi:hypothetical protein
LIVSAGRLAKCFAVTWIVANNLPNIASRSAKGARRMGSPPDHCFTTGQKLTQRDFEQLAVELSAKPVRARKIGFVAAVQTTVARRIETHWNGKETSNSANPGDWIATNLSPQQVPLRDRDGNLNTYVIPAARFFDLYEPTGIAGELGDVYKAKAVVLALRLPGGFDIIAPWGERQQAASGYLLHNGNEVYGNNAETFEATYEVLPD